MAPRIQKHDCLHERDFGSIDEKLNSIHSMLVDIKIQNKEASLEMAENTKFRTEAKGIIGVAMFVATILGGSVIFIVGKFVDLFTK